MSQKIVCMGLLATSEEEQKQIVEGFAEMELGPVKILASFLTKAGEGGEGGRSDVIMELADEFVPKAALHPLHLSGAFSWADDYYSNHKGIIPASAKKFFEEYKGGN